MVTAFSSKEIEASTLKSDDESGGGGQDKKRVLGTYQRGPTVKRCARTGNEAVGLETTTVVDLGVSLSFPFPRRVCRVGD
jgi:hypothetical protein